MIRWQVTDLEDTKEEVQIAYHSFINQFQNLQFQGKDFYCSFKYPASNLVSFLT